MQPWYGILGLLHNTSRKSHALAYGHINAMCEATVSQCVVFTLLLVPMSSLRDLEKQEHALRIFMHVVRRHVASGGKEIMLSRNYIQEKLQVPRRAFERAIKYLTDNEILTRLPKAAVQGKNGVRKEVYYRLNTASLAVRELVDFAHFVQAPNEALVCPRVLAKGLAAPRQANPAWSGQGFWPDRWDSVAISHPVILSSPDHQPTTNQPKNQRERNGDGQEEHASRSPAAPHTKSQAKPSHAEEDMLDVLFGSG